MHLLCLNQTPLTLLTDILRYAKYVSTVTKEEIVTEHHNKLICLYNKKDLSTLRFFS